MSLDGIVLHAIVHEWQSIVGGRINKIHQPNAHDIVMQIRTPGETIRLLLSANPTYPRVHITSRNFLNPLEALMFSMILRKQSNTHCLRITALQLQSVTKDEQSIHCWP